MNIWAAKQSWVSKYANEKAERLDKNKITKEYWYNEEKDPSEIGYIFTVSKKQPYFKFQLFAETQNQEQLKEAGYGMVIRGYDIYLPNNKILKNDRETIQTNEPKEIYIEGVKQDPYGPYIPIKELPDHYFPRFVLGFARPSTGQGFVRSTLYGEYKSEVKLHEKLHLLHPN